MNQRMKVEGHHAPGNRVTLSAACRQGRHRECTSVDCRDPYHGNWRTKKDVHSMNTQEVLCGHSLE